MTKFLSENPNSKPEKFADEFLAKLKAGGEYEETIRHNDKYVPLLFYFAYHFNCFGWEESMKIVIALLNKYKYDNKKEKLEAILCNPENDDLVEQAIYCNPEDELIKAYKDAGLLDAEELEAV